MSKIAVIGGGAAGFFAAINAAIINPSLCIYIFEKSKNVLSKVKISGGGRCNVTHACYDITRLIENYPRGNRELISAFNKFNPAHAVEWFSKRGVILKTEADGRMFPVTDNSQTIINCLISEAEKHAVKICYNISVTKFEKTGNEFALTFSDGHIENYTSVIIATGGSPSEKSYQWLKQLGINIIPPVPSLFTFNVPDSPLKGLEGVAVDKARVRIKDEKYFFVGPMLITHWGISGPAVLKLSSFAARAIHNHNYNFSVIINWLPELSDINLAERFSEIKKTSPTKKITSNSVFQLPQRLWERICTLSGIEESMQFSNLSKSKQNLLTDNLLRFTLTVIGKTTFKEEFVTCGGVDLKEVDMRTMQCKKIPGLYFAGEILDIDGLTGGFNFQAAWTTGYLAATSAGMNG